MPSGPQQLPLIRRGQVANDLVFEQVTQKPAVTWEDQQNINYFSNIYSNMGELEAQLKEQKVRRELLMNISSQLSLT